MASANTVILLGNLTRQPETKFFDQTPKCSFSLAMNRKWKGKDGGERDETCFVECVAWGKTAGVVQKYASKGDPLYIEGRLTLDQWTAQDGSKRSKLYVTVNNVQLLGQKPQGQQEQAGDDRDGMYEGSPF